MPAHNPTRSPSLPSLAVARRPRAAPGMRHAWLALLLAGGVWAVATPARAEVPAIFKGADLALGEKMMAEHKCAQCHISKVGGDGSAMYKPMGKFNTAGLMRGMVEMCNTEMNLGMFPEEVTAVAAVLNRDYYKFSK